MRFQKLVLCWILCAVFLGCDRAHVQSDQFIPLEGGFGYIAHATGADEKTLKQGLWYEEENHNLVPVWPHMQMIWGDNIQVNSNMAIFVGGIAATYSDGRERLSDRLIAFKAPDGPPVDVTDRVLEKFCLANGVERTNVVKDSFVSLEKTNGFLRIEFGIIKIGERGPGSINLHGATDMVSWDALNELVQKARHEGQWKTEKWSGTKYLY